ncbi:MAG: hypothetical protein LAO04_11580 [Acidobacteriia bacterium]|nr:hypothetical protein [Terriglobia bacterium]
MNYQGSITEVRGSDHRSDLTAVLGRVFTPSTVPPDISNPPVRQVALPSISPPLSPLLQTCLLLI